MGPAFDLWILCLWCFPSFIWCKNSTCTGGGCHQLQLALVVLFHSATSADSPLAHVVASPSAACAGVLFSIHPLPQILHLHPGNLHCVVVYIYIYKCVYLYLQHCHPLLHACHISSLQVMLYIYTVIVTVCVLV